MRGEITVKKGQRSKKGVHGATLEYANKKPTITV